MTKAELLSVLQEEQQTWQAFLDQVDPARMEQPGDNGDWSMKDVVAHLTGWNHWLVLRLQAAARGEAAPSPPWPAHLRTDDEINAWIYESNRERPAGDVLRESQEGFQQLMTTLKQLPEDVRIEQVQHPHRTYHLVWVGGERFPAAEFFDHFHDDHKPDIQAWLDRNVR